MRQPIRLLLALAMLGLMLALVLGATGCYTTPQAGEIGVVRNGGPFDNHNIRQIVDNGSGNTWPGWYSSTHYYPVDTQQRFFKMETCAGNDGRVCRGADAPAVTVPTSDGVEVRIEGTFYLNTVFNNSKQGRTALKSFDTQFATRTFNGRHAYDGTGGWSAFLGAIVEPIVANNLREVVAGTGCADLVSSCALVQNSSTAKTLDPQKLKSKNNQSNVARIQQAVEAGLSQDLKQTLGRDYFKNIKFNLKVVELPSQIQSAINEAQSAFAEVSKSQAKVQQARKDRQANIIRQQGYGRCRSCARQDENRSIPPSIKTYAPGAGLAVR